MSFLTFVCLKYTPRGTVIVICILLICLFQMELARKISCSKGILKKKITTPTIFLIYVAVAVFLWANTSSITAAGRWVLYH